MKTAHIPSLPEEPLYRLVKTYGVDVSSICEIASGQRYSAVCLKNGQIGVCANILERCCVSAEDLKKPDLEDITHRIILTAYFNAYLNYSNAYEKTIDIFEDIDFRGYQDVVMLGLFKPLLEKFCKEKIAVHVFDMIKQHPDLTPIELQPRFLAKAGAVILSATSIFNGTFLETINKTGEKCDIFILGPSAIMNPVLCTYRNVKQIFGAIFKKNDKRVIDAIKRGNGTKTFMTFGRKVSYPEKNN